MIIGIDASRANRGHKSGTEWYSYYIIRWLAKMDKNNQYILYTDEPLRGGLVDLTITQHHCDIPEAGAIFDKAGYQAIRSPHNNFRGKILKWPLKYFWTQGRLSLEMIFKRPDILFVPAHALPFIHPKKSIITIHDIGFERDRRLYRIEAMGPIDNRARKLLNILVYIFTMGRYRATTIDYLRWSTTYALKYAHTIITVSEFSKKEIEEYYRTEAAKIRVIHNGYNKSLYRPVNDKNRIKEVLTRYGIEPPYLLYIGRIEKKKNTPALIEAFAIMRETHKDIRHKLVLVGDASYGYDETNYMVEQFRLSEEVVMPGWVEEEDLPYFYAGATGFIFPSKYEGFGIPLLQAMACEVPIAASWASSIPEVVKDAAWLFDPLNVRSIADALYLIITDRELQDQLVAASRKRIAHFSWEKSARKTLAVIEEVAGRR